MKYGSFKQWKLSDFRIEFSWSVMWKILAPMMSMMYSEAEWHVKFIPIPGRWRGTGFQKEDLRQKLTVETSEIQRDKRFEFLRFFKKNNYDIHRNAWMPYWNLWCNHGKCAIKIHKILWYFEVSKNSDCWHWEELLKSIFTPVALITFKLYAL